MKAVHAENVPNQVGPRLINLDGGVINSKDAATVEGTFVVRYAGGADFDTLKHYEASNA